VISHCGAALHRHPPTDRHLAQKDLSKNLFYDTSAYDLHFLEAVSSSTACLSRCSALRRLGPVGIHDLRTADRMTTSCRSLRNLFSQ